jgi:polyhydroxybutyrate depolymerase
MRVLFTLLATAAACAQQPQAGSEKGVERRAIQAAGRERVYYLYRPAGKPKGPYPVVFAIHGGGGQALGMRRVGFDPLADRHGFAVVYPEGHNHGWNDGRLGARILRRSGNVDDVAFFRAMIDQLIAERTADPARLYATGPSNGGMMTFRIACDLADRVAAVAPVIANMQADRMELCRPSRPVPMLIINGTEDRLVPWNGGPVAGNPNGGMVVSVEKTLDLWRRLDGCTGEPRQRALPDRAPLDGTRTAESAWTNCAGGAELRLYRVEGGGHGWHGSSGVAPARIALTGKVSRDFNGAEEVWSFLSRFTLPAPRR